MATAVRKDVLVVNFDNLSLEYRNIIRGNVDLKKHSYNRLEEVIHNIELFFKSQLPNYRYWDYDEVFIFFEDDE